MNLFIKLEIVFFYMELLLIKFVQKTMKYMKLII